MKRKPQEMFLHYLQWVISIPEPIIQSIQSIYKICKNISFSQESNITALGQTNNHIYICINKITCTMHIQTTMYLIKDHRTFACLFYLFY